MRIILKFLFVLLIPGAAVAQVANTSATLIPQSPNSAALFKFTESPVSYYNGTVSPNIPIYEIETGKFKLPISLNYHSGGIKVNEEASWVGLGWSLEPGGTIGFSQVGSYDDAEIANNVPFMQHSIVPNLQNSFYGTPLNVIERGTCFPDTAGVMHNFTIFAPNNDNSGIERLGSSNREYDMYIYSFAGYSGKLINPKLNYYPDKLVTLDNSKIQFSFVSNPNGVNGMQAITPDGTIYLFNDIETTHVNTASGGAPNVTFTRHLTSITTPEGRVIHFTYQTVNTILMPPASHSLSTMGNGVTESKTIGEAPTVQALYLSQISWDNGTINFVTDNVRNDISGGLKLDQITVKNSLGTLIKTVNFSYDYFTGNIAYGDYFTQGSFVFSTASNFAQTLASNVGTRQLRLKLLSAQIDDQPAYTFTYNGTPLPYKTAFAKDLWDYFNGAQVTGLTGQAYSLLPDPANMGYYDKDIPPSFYAIPGYIPGQRYPDEPSMQAGMLIQVNYPTGGYSNYTYEANHFAPPAGVSFSIGTHYQSALDVNAALYDNKQVVFTVPSINSSTGTNSGKIDIRLACGCSVGCDIYNGNFGMSGNTNYSLYVTLEIYNTGTSTWNMVQVWDYSHPEISGSHGIYSMPYEFTQGAQYRITANYPDRAECNPNLMSSGAASIGVTYYDYSVIPKPNIGGGVRIKTITDHNFNGELAGTRNFTYGGGRLLTKPRFLRVVTRSPYTFKAITCEADPCLGCEVFGDLFPVYISGTDIQVDERFFAGYYSEPQNPYSYGANGSPVGYDTVIAETIGQSGNERTRYIYHNAVDTLLSAQVPVANGVYNPDMHVEVSTVPGIPGIKDPLNGTLLSQTEYKLYQQVYQPVKTTTFQYQLANKKTYWAYKTEGSIISGITAEMNAMCSLPPSFFLPCNESLSEYLYLYPVMTGNVILVSKTENYTDGNNTVQTTTHYTYEAANQLASEVSLDSKGHKIAKWTYYSADFPATGTVLPQMVNNNMLSYPVQEFTYDSTLGEELNRTNTNYQAYNGTTLVLPATVANSFKGNTAETSASFDNYDNKGNLLQMTPRNGVPVCYIWGYNQTYPVAKVIGAAYSDIMAALGQTDPNLAYLQSLSDGALTTQMTTLRNNLKISKPSAEVSTYLYTPLVGINQAIDANNRITYYDYDADWRLTQIRDQDGNIIKTFNYKYR